jgi:hypothetical protein
MGRIFSAILCKYFIGFFKMPHRFTLPVVLLVQFGTVAGFEPIDETIGKLIHPKNNPTR